MRRQPPAYSPLTVEDVVRAVFGGHRRVGAGPGSGAAPPLEGLGLALARRLDAAPDRIVLTGSGTQALVLALRAVVGARGQGPVAVPAYTCWDVGTAVQAIGLEARFFDLDPTDLTPDLDSVETALTDGAVALVVSPLFGYPVDWGALRAVARARGAVLVEDAAQGHGSRWAGRVPGTFGDVAILSFARGKGWTGGGGGALVVRSPRLAEHVDRPPPGSGASFLSRWLPQALAQAVGGRPTLYGLPASLPWLKLGESVYHPPTRPTGMAEIQAALLLATADAAEEEARRRRERGAFLLRRIPATSRIRPVTPADPAEPGFLRLPVLIDDPPGAWLRAAATLGVVRGYPRVLPEVPELRPVVPPSLPPLAGARTLARRLFTVPTHSRVSEEEVGRILAYLTNL